MTGLDATLPILGGLASFLFTLLAIFLLIVRSERPLANRLLAAFLLLTAFDLAGWIIPETLAETRWLNTLRMAASFLQMPCFTGFIAAACFSDFRLRPRDLLHALPFVAALLWLGIVAAQAMVSQYSAALVFAVAIHVQYYAYIALAIVLLIRFRAIVLRAYADGRAQIFAWLSRIVAVSFVAHGLVLMRTALDFGGGAAWLSLAQLASAVLILAIASWFVFEAMLRPQLFRGVEAERAPSPRPASTSEEEPPLIGPIADFMKAEKPHLDPALSLKGLASQLALTERELSTAINRHTGLHFFDFVNRYRIDHAKALLADPREADRSVLDILYASGFNSKSSFNTAFRKHAGTTPTGYRRQFAENASR